MVLLRVLAMLRGSLAPALMLSPVLMLAPTLMPAPTLMLALAPAMALLAMSPVLLGDVAVAANEATVLILHAIPGEPENTCATPAAGGFDCVSVPPAVDIPPGGPVDIYLFIRRFDEVAGLQCAFDWPDPDWSYLGFVGGCLPGQAEATVPAGPGALIGTLIVSFDCLTGGALSPIGFLRFVAGSGGCLELLDATAPPGMTSVSSCTASATAVPDEQRGRICVGVGGRAVCGVSPVAAATWGSVKARYAAPGGQRPAR